MPNRMNPARHVRALRLAVAVGAGLLLTGCGDFMEVTNPGAIEPPSLDDVAYLGLMHDGVVGDFQPATAWTALFSGFFTDELRMGHSYFENVEIDQRRVTPENATAFMAVFNGLHRARFLADSVAGRYRILLGDSVANDPRYTRVLAYAGYAWLLMGENLCESRINATGSPLPPAEMFAEATKRFDTAIGAAAQARTAADRISVAATRARVIALMDSLVNLARVGAARTALNAGDKAKAITFAQSVVPAYTSYAAPGFRYNLTYKQGASSAETRRFGLPNWEFISAGASWAILSGTGYEQLNDPRVPHEPAGSISTSIGGSYFVPNAPPSFGVYSGTLTGARFTRDTPLRLASAIEARYILAEAQGVTANNVQFLNEMRAIGGMAPLSNPSEAEYQAALRVQRAREFFMDGHRMGDLRRYERMYSVDLWPTGPMYGTTTTFGDQKCWPVPSNELY